MHVIGIDPVAHDGGVAFWDGQKLEVQTLPAIDALVQQIRDRGPTRAFVYRLKPPKRAVGRAVINQIDFSRVYYTITGALAGLQIRFDELDEQEVFRFMHRSVPITGDTEARNEMAAKKLFPEERWRASNLGRNPGKVHQGMVRAALIAELGRRFVAPKVPV